MNHVKFTIAAAAIACSAQLSAATSILDAYTRVSPGETVTAPFTAASGITTAQSYSGLVEIEIGGVGQSAGTSYNDAFYVYQGGGDLGAYYELGIGTPLRTYAPSSAASYAAQYIRFIEGLGSVAAGTVPAYSATHQYHFVVDLGSFAAVPIVFGVTDGQFSDNSGAYTITAHQLVAGATPTVPEPASWAMLIGGLALVGATMRRRARMLRFA